MVSAGAQMHNNSYTCNHEEIPDQLVCYNYRLRDHVLAPSRYPGSRREQASGVCSICPFYGADQRFNKTCYPGTCHPCNGRQFRHSCAAYQHSTVRISIYAGTERIRRRHHDIEFLVGSTWRRDTVSYFRDTELCRQRSCLSLAPFWLRDSGRPEKARIRHTIEHPIAATITI